MKTLNWVKNMKFILISFCVCFCFCFEQKNSNQTVDGVLAIVGENIVTQSDFFEQLKILSERSGINSSNMPLKYGRLAENLLLNIVDQLVLLEHAKMDTNIFIGDEEVKNQLDLQISGFINNMGSVEALEKYLNKSLREIKAFYFLTVCLAYFLLLYVWINFSDHSYLWLPYKFIV